MPRLARPQSQLIVSANVQQLFSTAKAGDRQGELLRFLVAAP
ncbi:hypothetical protein NON20_22490 [Synechocystis sp. B12]|nr:hypothetical protein NON20_22490 [Synechocystis sp. B12]